MATRRKWVSAAGQTHALVRRASARYHVQPGRVSGEIQRRGRYRLAQGHRRSPQSAVPMMVHDDRRAVRVRERGDDPDFQRAVSGAQVLELVLHCHATEREGKRPVVVKSRRVAAPNEFGPSGEAVIDTGREPLLGQLSKCLESRACASSSSRGDT